MGLFDFEDQESKPVVIDAAHTSSEKTKNKLLSRLFVFVLALLGAAVLWFLSALNHNYTSYINYPIRIVYDASKYVPLSKLPTNVSINATGYGWDFLRKTISVKKKPILLKPTNLPSQKYFTDDKLLNAFSHQLTTIKVNFFETDTMFFDFDLVVNKQLYIVIDTAQCKLTDSTIPFSFKVTPSLINVSGAKTILSNLPDTIRVLLFKKELEVGFSEVFEIPELRNAAFKTDANEVEIVIEKK